MEFLAAALFIFLFVLVFVIGGGFYLVKYYTDPGDSNLLSTTTTVLSLTLTLISVMIIPIDILVTSSDEYSTLVSPQVIRSGLVSIFCFMLILSFILVPFSYFYTEEVLDDLYSSELSTCSKLITAFKYTILTNIFTLVLIFFGLSFKMQSDDLSKSKEWTKKLFDIGSTAETAISFSVACLTVFGGALWSVYTSYGMAVLPSLLIWGSASEKDQIIEINYSLAVIEDRIKDIELKPHKGKKLNSEKKSLEKEQKKMIKISEKLKKNKDGFGVRFIQKVVLPFRVMIGIVFTVLSLSFIFSLLISCVNRLMHSDCGYKCGFMTDKTLLINPLDYFLTKSSAYFPLDYFFFILLILYKYTSSLFGLISSGIQICCILIFPIKPKKSLPQGMLLLSVIIMLIFLGIYMETLSVFPIYSTFGNQSFEEDGKTILCSFETFNQKCEMSQGSQLFNKFSLSIPVFGLIAYLENWVFIVYFFVYGFQALNNKKLQLLDDDDVDGDDFDN